MKSLRFCCLTVLLSLPGCAPSAPAPPARTGGATENQAPASAGASAPASEPAVVLRAPVSEPVPKGAANSPAPAPAVLKPAAQLKVPEGLDEPVTEIKSPKSGWDNISARPGDWIEMELATTHMRIEVYDIADHAIVQVSDVRIRVGDMEMKSKSVIKNLFTGPELDPTDENYVRFEKKPSQRKFQIDGQEVVADTEIHGYKGGKLINKSWTSRQVPLGTLLSEDAEGNVLSRLLRFGRKG